MHGRAKTRSTASCYWIYRDAADGVGALIGGKSSGERRRVAPRNLGSRLTFSRTP
jgi:hypothetical protein